MSFESSKMSESPLSLETAQLYLHAGRRGLGSRYLGGPPSGGCETPRENWWHKYTWGSCTSSRPRVSPCGECASGCSPHSWTYGRQQQIKSIPLWNKAGIHIVTLKEWNAHHPLPLTPDFTLRSAFMWHCKTLCNLLAFVM